MIEVLALASAVSTISGGISSAIKAGRDVSDLLPHFGRLAKLDTEIQLAESGKHKGPLGRLSSSEEEGFAIAQAKMKHKEALELQAKQRDQIFWGVSVVIGVLVFVGGCVAMIYGLNEAVNG